MTYGLSDLSDRYAVGLAPVTTYPSVGDLADDVPADVDVSSQRQRIVEYVRSTLPGLSPRPVGDVLRLTTTLPSRPDDGFEVWRHGPVLAVAGPNVFKFAPAIGDRLTRTVLGDPRLCHIDEQVADRSATAIGLDHPSGSATRVETRAGRRTARTSSP